MSLFGRLFGFSRARPGPADLGSPRPEAPLYVIGDIHGCADLLDWMIDLIDADRAGQTVVTVGDYVDRGEQSAAVLDRLFHLNTSDRSRFVCLMGNHERMMLEFLDQPAERGPRWLRNGGIETMASFGIGGITDAAGPEQLIAARHALAKALPAHLVSWLRRLPQSWSSGNLWVVHAAADPRQPMAAQESQTLLWGHADFLNRPRDDGIWVAHGHTVVTSPGAAQSRIATDTGAYFTGVLTAAAIAPGAPVRFLQTIR
jgi:serine/threonine protein phosphatase 1